MFASLGESKREAARRIGDELTSKRSRQVSYHCLMSAILKDSKAMLLLLI